jgi:hypothetical protein
MSQNQPWPLKKPRPPRRRAASRISKTFEDRFRALEARVSYFEKLAELQAGLNDNSRLSLVCALEALKKLESFVGVSLMPKGTYSGVRFR